MWESRAKKERRKGRSHFAGELLRSGCEWFDDFWLLLSSLDGLILMEKVGKSHSYTFLNNILPKTILFYSELFKRGKMIGAKIETCLWCMKISSPWSSLEGLSIQLIFLKLKMKSEKYTLPGFLLKDAKNRKKWLKRTPSSSVKWCQSVRKRGICQLEIACSSSSRRTKVKQEGECLFMVQCWTPPPLWSGVFCPVRRRPGAKEHPHRVPVHLLNF